MNSPVEVARLADIRGMTRVDFLMDGGTGDVYVSEVNTIPGMTATSLFPDAAAAAGIPFPELCEQLVDLALGSWRDRRGGA